VCWVLGVGPSLSWGNTRACADEVDDELFDVREDGHPQEHLLGVVAVEGEPGGQARDHVRHHTEGVHAAPRDLLRRGGGFHTTVTGTQD
jgi:hypothetical protein